ncbi:MAG: VOC family protein [Thermoproteota archaeon]|nr:VOC family protein [Thermoproteota archaeon]
MKFQATIWKKKFYTDLFGWKIEKMPGTDQREYWTFATTTNDKGGSNNGGGEQRTVSGGMLERQMPQEPIMIYIGVDSVTEYSNKVERLGGKVIKQKTEVPGYGWFAICTDTENNGFALWEANTKN